MKKIRALLSQFRYNSITTSMIFSFTILIAIIVLSVSMLSYSYTIRDFETISIDYTSQLLREINSSIDSYIYNMKSMGQVVVGNKDVRDLMSFYRDTAGKILTKEEENHVNILKAQSAAHMNVVASTRSDITNIAIISKNKDIVLNDSTKKVNPNSNFNVRDWYLKPLSYTKDIIVSPSHVQNLIKDEYKWVISISQAITDPITNEVTGVMVIDLNYKSIEDICENAQFGKSGYLFIMDNNKNIIYHPQQQLIYSGIKSEPMRQILDMQEENIYTGDSSGKKIYTKNHSVLTEWSAVGVVNSDELIQNKANIIQFYVFLAGVSIIFATVIAVIISNAITKPIKELENTMHTVEEGNLDIKSEVLLNNEIGHLSNTFNVMISRIKNLMQSAMSTEEEKRKSEIRALQAQINPHFLYNTLDTIIWMSASGQNEEVVEVTSALAKLFRTSISKGDNLVPLGVELENIRSYLTIQKMRYADKLTYEISVSAELLSMKTPKLILQPIVENAVYHGIKLSPDGGKISITGESDGKIMRLKVSDNGIGMSKEQVSQMFEAKESGDHGIGVTNVNNRIKLCFGDEYGLTCESRQGEGTVVTITLPLIAEEEEEEK